MFPNPFTFYWHLWGDVIYSTLYCLYQCILGKLPKARKSVRVTGHKLASISSCSLQSTALSLSCSLFLSVRPAGLAVFKFLIIVQHHTDWSNQIRAVSWTLVQRFVRWPSLCPLISTLDGRYSDETSVSDQAHTTHIYWNNSVTYWKNSVNTIFLADFQNSFFVQDRNFQWQYCRISFYLVWC